MSIRISQLPAGSAPTGTEPIPAVQGGNTVSLTATQVNQVPSVNIPAPGSGVCRTLNGAGGSPTETLIGSTTAGASFGLRVQAGTTVADKAIDILNSALTQQFLQVFGDGSFNLGWNGNFNSVFFSGDGTNGGVTLSGSNARDGLRIGATTTGAGQNVLNLVGSTSVGNSHGLKISAGTSNTDDAINVTNATGGTTLIKLKGDGTLQGHGPLANAAVDLTGDNGSWTGTLSGGLVANPTGTVKWERNGSIVHVWIDANITNTSSAVTDLTLSGLPVAITPSSNRTVPCFGVVNAGVLSVLGMATIQTGNTVLLQVTGTGPPLAALVNSYTNSGTKGLAAGWSITYGL